MAPDAFKFLLTLMFFVVVIPVVLGIGSSMFNRWLRHKERALELMADRTAEKAAQYAAHVEKLEQRMRVLERIATDRGADLAMQIEDLRDSAQEGEKLQ
jgi:hypothetical protein